MIACPQRSTDTTCRAGVIEVMRSDYVRTARLNGLPEPKIVWRHALPNALAPAVQP